MRDRLFRTNQADLAYLKGFTLIELVVVLFIIVLFTALVYPNLSLNTGQTKKDIHMMASVLRYVRDSALYQKRSLKVVFDFKGKTVRYEGPEGERSVELKALLGVKTPTHGLVRDGQLIVIFNILGQAEPMVVYFQQDECVEYNPFSQIVRERRCEEEKTVEG